MDEKVVRAVYDCAKCVHCDWDENNNIVCNRGNVKKFVYDFLPHSNIAEKSCIYFTVLKNTIMVEGKPKKLAIKKPALFNLPQVATMLDVSKARLYILFNCGLLPEPACSETKNGTTRRYFTVDEVDEIQQKLQLIRENVNVNARIREYRRNYRKKQAALKKQKEQQNKEGE